MSERWYESERGRQEMGIRVGRKLDRLGVETIIADHDDTWCQTRKSFESALEDAAGWLVYDNLWPQVRENGFDKEKVHNFRIGVLDTMVRRLRNKYVVNPMIMEKAVREASLNVGYQGDEEAVEAAVERVRQIYSPDDVPKLYTGAGETLALLKGTGIRVILATHAEEGWAVSKLMGTGIREKFDRVVCFEINTPKSVQWERKLEEVGIQGSLGGVLFMGDNLPADVVRPLELGARAGVWVSNRRRHIYGVENNPEPSKVAELKRRMVRVNEIGFVPCGILTLAE